MTDRYPGVALAFGNPGFLQQWQRSAAGADEDEFGLDIPLLSAFFVPDSHTPQPSITAQILHSAEKVNAESILIAFGIKEISHNAISDTAVDLVGVRADRFRGSPLASRGPRQNGQGLKRPHSPRYPGC